MMITLFNKSNVRGYESQMFNTTGVEGKTLAYGTDATDSAIASVLSGQFDRDHVRPGEWVMGRLGEGETG